MSEAPARNHSDIPSGHSIPWEQGLPLLGPDGLLKQLTKSVIEPNEEMTELLGHGKNRASEGWDSSNVRHGTHSRTVLTHALEIS